MPATVGLLLASVNSVNSNHIGRWCMLAMTRGSAADLSTKTLWPHHWCPSQSTLATSARAHPIQNRRTDVRCSAGRSAMVPWTTRPSSRSAGRGALRSASSSRLVAPMFRLSTVRSRTLKFLVWAKLWNDDILIQWSNEHENSKNSSSVYAYVSMDTLCLFD